MGNFKFFFQNFPEVGKLKKKKELFRPRVNFGEKQKVYLQDFVPEGHPNIEWFQMFIITVGETSPIWYKVCSLPLTTFWIHFVGSFLFPPLWMLYHKFNFCSTLYYFDIKCAVCHWLRSEFISLVHFYSPLCECFIINLIFVQLFITLILFDEHML